MQADDKVYGPYPIYGGLPYFAYKYRKFYVSVTFGWRYTVGHCFNDRVIQFSARKSCAY